MCTQEKDIHLQENYAARWASCLLEFLSSEHEHKQASSAASSEFAGNRTCACDSFQISNHCILKSFDQLLQKAGARGDCTQ